MFDLHIIKKFKFVHKSHITNVFYKCFHLENHVRAVREFYFFKKKKLKSNILMEIYKHLFLFFLKKLISIKKNIKIKLL